MSLDCDDDGGNDESSRKDRDDGIVIYIESNAGISERCVIASRSGDAQY